MAYTLALGVLFIDVLALKTAAVVAQRTDVQKKKRSTRATAAFFCGRLFFTTTIFRHRHRRRRRRRRRHCMDMCIGMCI